MLALFATLSVAAVVVALGSGAPFQQSFIHELDIPARVMLGTEDSSGDSSFSGSASLQSAALYFGNWFSQQLIRGTSGGVGTDNELLLGDTVCKSCSLTRAAQTLLLDTDSWDDTREVLTAEEGNMV